MGWKQILNRFEIEPELKRIILEGCLFELNINDEEKIIKAKVRVNKKFLHHFNELKIINHASDWSVIIEIIANE